MTKIMLEMIPLVFQCIARLILDAPPRSPAPHKLVHGAFTHAKIGDPATVLDGIPVPLPALQEVDPEVTIGLIEWHITDKPKPMAQPRLGVIPIIIDDAPSLLGRRDVREQVGMIPLFNTQNIMDIVIVQHLDMGSVGTQAVFGDDQLKMGVVLAQFRDEALGGIALTIVFLGAVLLDNRLGHERNDFALIGMNERGAQHLVPIGNEAIAVMRCQTRVTVNVVGGKIACAIEG